ncbi:hypothetical protein GCM10022286_00480 [Gryllotalpicola daejeonensis]|uniref:DUF3263 domain-containing protein n=1 Tax=Gryllotalpicola daejeonensis TaxID=993087 RepID=A0ABP7ZCS1_9MICO
MTDPTLDEAQKVLGAPPDALPADVTRAHLSAFSQLLRLPQSAQRTAFGRELRAAHELVLTDAWVRFSTPTTATARPKPRRRRKPKKGNS